MMPVKTPLVLVLVLQVKRARQQVTANYPDPILENPNGWRVGAKAQATMNVATTADPLFQNTATANSKLAPAIALAATSTLTNSDTLALTQAETFARPGLQYGVSLSKAEQNMVNLSECCCFPSPLFAIPISTCFIKDS